MVERVFLHGHQQHGEQRGDRHQDRHRAEGLASLHGRAEMRQRFYEQEKAGGLKDITTTPKKEDALAAAAEPATAIRNRRKRMAVV